MKLASLLAIAFIAAAQPSGRVEGKVVNLEGRALPAATVTLRGLTPTGTPPEPDIYIAATDGEGLFRIDGILPGTYEASASREGYTREYRGTVRGKSTHRVIVAPGQVAGAVMLRLAPLGVISGRILDRDGDPIPVVAVQVLRQIYVDGKRVRTPVTTATTDDRGRYRIFDLMPGRYYLLASQAAPLLGRATTMFKLRGPGVLEEPTPTYFPNVTDAALAMPLDLPAGGELSDVNIRIVQQSSYRIRVNVMAPPGTSKAKLEVMALAGAGISIGIDVSPGIPYEHPPSAPGKYLVEAEDRERSLVARQIVTLGSADLDVTLNLASDLTVTGMVRVEGGGDLKPDNVRLRFDSEEGAHGVNTLARPDGSFRMTHLRPARYRVGTQFRGGGGYLAAVRMGDRELPVNQIDMTSSPGPLTVTVRTDGGRLDGLVRDSQGEPLESGSVVLIPTGSLRGRLDLTKPAITDGDGRFTLRDIAPGAYRLFAFEDAEDGAALDPEFRERFEKQAIDVEVAANGRHTIEVKAIAVLLK